MEDAVIPAQKLIELYAEHDQPSPPNDVLAKITSSPEIFSEINRALVDIARVRKQKLNRLLPQTIDISIRYGITNLSGTVIPMLEDKNMSEMNLRDAEIKNKSVFNVNFSSADLTNADLTGTEFSHSLLHTAEMDSIRIKNRRIELWDQPLELNDTFWEIHKTSFGVVPSCSDCERINKMIMKSEDIRKSNYGRRGVLLFQGGAPLGYMKLKGENSFLAIRTVTNEDQEVIFWQGMVYALEHRLQSLLENLSESYKDINNVWRKIDLERIGELKVNEGKPHPSRIGRNNLRFIADPELYPLMTKLVERIESGTEPMIDILDSV